MSRSFTLLLFLFALLSTACSSTAPLTTGEVNFLSEPEPGTLEVRAAGYGDNYFAALANAEVNAFNNLLFRGILGSQHHLPMIADQAEARKQHAGYFQQLLDQQGYKAFLMESGASGYTRSAKSLEARIKINVSALRRDMEQHQVIRKFGI